MPILRERMSLVSSAHERRERSEAVRFITVELLQIFINQLQKQMDIHMDTMYTILSNGCTDPDPSVNVISCKLVLEICSERKNQY